MRFLLRSSFFAACLVFTLLIGSDAARTQAGEYGPGYGGGPEDLRTVEGPWQQPVDLAWVEASQTLAVLLRSSGQLLSVDPSVGEVGATDASLNAIKHRVSLDGKPTALAVIPGTNFCLVTDDQKHVVHLCQVASDGVRKLTELKVSPYPVSIVIGSDRSGGVIAYVASMWSKQLSLVKVATDSPALSLVRTIDLPFAPRAMTEFAKEQQLVIGDAFSGQLLVLPLKTLEPGPVRSFLAHNLRALAVSSDKQKLVLTHQMLNDAAETTRTDVHWGLVMSNDLRWLKKEQVFKPGTSQDLYFGSHMQPMGEPGRGAADPAGLVIGRDGTVVVALAGVNEVGIGKESDLALYRVSVGHLPRAVVLSSDEKLAFVANYGDDTISCVDLAKREVIRTIALGPKPEFNQVEQGELLFHNAKLSHDSWMTCASCHVDGHTSNQLNDNLSDKSFGAAKRVLSLLGVKDTLPLAWNGQAPSIGHQVTSSIERTMQAPDDAKPAEVQAITAYLETLTIPASVARLRGTEDTQAITRGKAIFVQRDCAKCHAGEHFTSEETYDVGLRDSAGNKKFNPPSLQGLSHRGPFFHDNSAGQLKEVFQTHGHPGNATYSEEEVRDLTAFLESL